jgi:hypothetical protein
MACLSYVFSHDLALVPSAALGMQVEVANFGPLHPDGPLFDRSTQRTRHWLMICLFLPLRMAALVKIADGQPGMIRDGFDDDVERSREKLRVYFSR